MKNRTLLHPFFSRTLPRQALLAGAAGVLGLSLSLCSQILYAQLYPSKPIRLIIPFNAGGALDIVGRLLANELSKEFNQPVIVENKAGAGGNIAAFPYKGGAPAATDLMSGQVQLMFTNQITAISALQTGNVKILGTASTVRNKTLPDVPTFAEQGMNDFLVAVWWGVFDQLA